MSPHLLTIRFWTIRFLAVIIAIGLGSVMQANIVYADTKTFVVAVHEWPPLTSHEAKYFGIAPRIATEILQNQGVAVKYRFVPWSTALDGVITKEYDGAIIWVTEDLHLESFMVSGALLEYQTALFYRKSTPSPNTANDLIGFRMGVNSHAIYDATSYRLLKKHDMESIEGTNDIEQLHNLLDGKIDFYLSPLITSTPLALSSLTKDEQNALTYSTNLFKFPSPHLVVNRNREGSAEFIKTFNARLNRMKNDGTVDRYINDFRLTSY